MSKKRVHELAKQLKEQGIDVELGNWRGIFGAPGISPQQRDALVAMVVLAFLPLLPCPPAPLLPCSPAEN